MIIHDTPVYGINETKDDGQANKTMSKPWKTTWVWIVVASLCL